LLRPAFRRCLFGLAALAGFSASPAHAQYADWKASPPKILPNERVGSGGVFQTGSGRQFPNLQAFAALRADGSIAAWGSAAHGGNDAPAGSGYKAVYSNAHAFAALKADGSITTWGDPIQGGSGMPAGSGYTAISSTQTAFAALKGDGSIAAWGSASYGGSGTPTGSGYKAISSTSWGFAALKADGSISAWGGNDTIPTAAAPTDSGYTAIYSNQHAFAALKADGSIRVWGAVAAGGFGAPTGSGYTAVYSNHFAFAALRADGSIAAWGDFNYGGNGAPTGNGYTAIFSTQTAFAALKADGSISAWGGVGVGGGGAPTGVGFTAISSNQYAFAALKTDGSISSWGSATYGGAASAPAGTGYTAIYSNLAAFAALRADGSIAAWGEFSAGGSDAPTGSGYTTIYATGFAFAALKEDGSISVWGDSGAGGSGAPAGTGYRIQSVFYYPSGPGLSPTLGSLTASSAVIGGNVADDGGKTLAERGVVYAETLTNADPELGGTGVIQLVEDPAATLGDYSFSLSGLPGNTAYSFRAYVTDADGGIYYSGLEVFSTNQAPVITSNGGGSSALVSLVENNTVATTVLASDGDLPAQTLSYRIAGGADAAKFRINASSGVLEFVTAPDFETAGDVGADNRYELTVEVSDNGNFIKSATQALTIQVTNLAEPALVNAATVSGLAITGATLGGTVVNDGGSGTITERGVVYALTSQNSNPQIGGSGVTKLTVAGTTGTFSRGLSGLTASTAYTFKVYATNANGTVYSSAVNFTTLGTNAAPGIFYDIPAVLRPSVAVSYAPVQIGSAVADGPYLQVSNFAGSGTAGETDATGTSATFKRPTGATVDVDGNVYVADNGNHKIRKITPQGVVTTLAGDGYEAFFVGRLKNANGTAASFNYPTDLAVDPAAQFLYVADKLNDVIRRVSLTSPYPVTTFAGSGTGGMLDSATASTAKFSDPEGIAVDPTGTYLYVADRKNHRIRQITIATAAVTTLAGSGSAGTADHANPLSATFDEPTGIAVDAAGQIYVTDFGGNKVRKIAVTAGVAGPVTSLGGSATFSGPYGVDVDGAGNVHVTEQTGHLVRVISPSGSVSTLAGVSGTAGSSEGIGLAATFNQPSGIAIHPNGVAYITHYDNAATGNKIRKINLNGYRLTGSLPAGLSFNASTGVISGTPLGIQLASAFSVSAFNYYGSASTALSVAVGLDPVFAAADTTVLEVGSFVATGVLGDLRLGFVPAPGSILTLVNNTGSSPIVGTFTGLPERSLLTATYGGESYSFILSYAGGTGNDITLTRYIVSDGTPDPFYQAAHGSKLGRPSINNSAIDAKGRWFGVGVFDTYDQLAARGLLCLKADGTPDTAFHANLGTGFKHVHQAYPKTLVFRRNGKILIGGQFSSLNDVPIIRSVVCLNPDGTPDTAFNEKLNALPHQFGYNALGEQADGKIVGDFSTGVRRLNLDGTVDAAFGNPSPFPDRKVLSIAVQPDGKILIGGKGALKRLNPDGTADTAFNTALGSGFSSDKDVLAIRVAPGGTIWVGGNFTTFNQTTVPGMVPLNPDGTLNSALLAAFAPALAGNSSVTILDFLFQADGKIVVAGSFGKFDGRSSGGLFRLNADGSPDSQFTTRLGKGFNAAVITVAMRATGELVVGGSFREVNGQTAVGIAQLSTGGSLSPATQIATGTYFRILTPTSAFTVTGVSGTVSYTISPKLPGGLFVDAATGVISGSPTAVLTTPTNFTVTAKGATGGTATSTVTLTVAKALLTVTAKSVERPFGRTNPKFSARVTGQTESSRTVVSYSGAPSFTCAATVTSPLGSYPITVGPGTLAAANYNFEFVSGSLTVDKAAQTLTIAPLATSVPLKDLGSVNLSASSSGGLPVTLSLEPGSAATLSGSVGGYSLTGIGQTGSVTLRASQAGNDNYHAAQDVLVSFNVIKLNQTLSFAAPANPFAGAAPFSLAATANSSLPVSFTLVSGPAQLEGSIITLTGEGTVVVRASQAGDENYNEATALDRSFTVAPPDIPTLTIATALRDVRLVTATTALLSGRIGSDGGAAITECGVVYAQVGINEDPLIGGAGVTQVAGTDPDINFSVTASGLTPATEYCFRAYAINAVGLAYGPKFTFTSGAPVLPGEVVLLDTTAGGTVDLSEQDGGGLSAEGGRGLHFTTGPQVYQLSSLRVALRGTVVEAFTISLHAVDAAFQPVGEAVFAKSYIPQPFGDIVDYSTWALPRVQLAPGTRYVLNLQSSGSGRLNLVYSSAAPTSAAAWVFHSFAVISGGTHYLVPSLSSVTLSGVLPSAAPTLAAEPIRMQIESATATLGGEVTAAGDAAITQRGVVFAATAVNPTPAIGGGGVTQLTADGSLGIFDVEASGLSAGTAYSVRAYATNSLGTSYSEVGTFTTEGAASVAASLPLFAGYAVTAKTGKTAAISPAKILARASDPDGGKVTLTRVFGPSAQGGTVSLTGTVNYTPPASFTGADSFDIELTGSQGGILRATIMVTVTGDAAAGLNQTELKLRDGKVDLTFRGIPGRSYTVQRSTNLLTWTTLATVTATADGRITVTDPSPPQPSAYYRTQP
jgi:uncharacterized delta-60 repeat protein